MPWMRQDENGNWYFEDGRSSVDAMLHIKDKHIFLQLNDLYHIDTCAHPARPDTLILPRIATFRKNLDRKRSSLAAKSPCSFVLCGDFLAPCYLSSLCDHGAQMVEVLNALGISFVTLGNHEFDRFRPGITDDELMKALCERIEQSSFDWVISNVSFDSPVFYQSGKIKSEVTWQTPAMQIKLVGLLTKNERYPAFVSVTDPVEEAQKLAKASDRSSFTVAMTHLDLAEDLKVAPYFNMVLGGHDHDEFEPFVAASAAAGVSPTPDADDAAYARPPGAAGIGIKGLSDARSLAVTWVILLDRTFFDGMQYERALWDEVAPHFGGDMVRLRQAAFEHARIDLLRDRVLYDLGEALFDEELDTGDPRLKSLLDLLETSPTGQTAKISIDWRPHSGGIPVVFSVNIDTSAELFQKIRPDKDIEALILGKVAQHKRQTFFQCPTRLGLADQFVRSQSTNFGNFVADCMLQAAGSAACALINGGSFRLGRDLMEGEDLTDLVLGDIFYYDNEVLVYKLTGDLLTKVFKQAVNLRGKGDFLQIAGMKIRDGVPDPALNSSQCYLVVTTNYIAGQSRHYRDLFAQGSQNSVVGSLKDLVVDIWLKSGL